MSIQIARVKRIDTHAELLRLAADFVQRREAIVNIEHGVLEALCHDRTSELLEFEHEVRVLFSFLVIQILWETEKQNVAKKVENRFLGRRIASFSGGDGALDHLPILLADRLTRRQISSVNWKTGNGFANRARERFKGKVPIPAVLFR